MQRRKIPTILSILCMVAGFLFLFYPDLSNMQKSMEHNAILREYDMMIAQLTPEEIDRQLYTAATHNILLSTLPDTQPLRIGIAAHLPDDYDETLYVQGVMAWIDIPTIDVSLPVLHGTEPEVLARGVGHLEGTAFPTGGYSTHSVLTTHSGMAGTRLFTDLHLLEYDDIFFVSVMGQRLAYQVDRITIVLPHEIESLRITPGEDLMTLITCTPIAINTHRLLVRGTRIPYVYYMADEITPVALSTGFTTRATAFLAFLAIYLYLWRSRRRPRVNPEI